MSLREDKLIAIDGKRVTILDFEGLSLICDFENSYLGGAARAIGREMALLKLEEHSQGKRSEPIDLPVRGTRTSNTR